MKILVLTIGILMLFSCSNKVKSIPNKYSIQLSENAGMLPYGTKYYLSNHGESYVEFFTNGTSNKVSIEANEKVLQKLIQLVIDSDFEKIKTYEEEVYDRGGNAISVTLDGTKYSKSNMGSSFIKLKWQAAYSIIQQEIQNICKAQLDQQLISTKVKIDEYLTAAEYRSAFEFNAGIYSEYTTRNDESNFKNEFEVKLIPGKNSITANISKASERRYLTVMNLQKSIEIDEQVKSILLYKDQDKIAIAINEAVAPLGSISNAEYPTIVEEAELTENPISSYLNIDINSEEDPGAPSYFNVKFSFNGEGGKQVSLLETFGSLEDSYEKIKYYLIETGHENTPYLFYYNGQAGDEYNQAGELVLFNNDGVIDRIKLNDGNRIASKLIILDKAYIRIKEAFFCHLGLETTINYNEGKLTRLEGFFGPNTYFPNNEEMPETAAKQTIELKETFTVEIDGKATTYQNGDQIRIRLECVDYDLGVIFFTINDEHKVSLPIETFKNLQFAQSMYGAKCEMG